MRVYIPLNLLTITDGPTRKSLRQIDDFLRQVSRQLSVHAATDDSSTGGNVASIKANAGAKRTGDLVFTDTTSVALDQVGQNFQWRALRGTPVGLDANSANADGGVATLASSAHTHAITSAVPSGGYGTSAAVGSGAGFLREDARFVYPEALAPVSDRTRTLTLTDAASGPTLTPSATWAGPDLTLLAPGGGIFTARVSAFGHLALAGLQASATIVLSANRAAAGLEFNSATAVTGIQANIKNLGVGAPTAMTFLANAAGGTTSGSWVGCNGIVRSDNASNTVDASCFRSIFQMTAASSHTNLSHLRMQQLAESAAANIANLRGCHFESPGGGVVTVTNLYPFDVVGMSKGSTERIGFRCAGAAGGSAARTIGLDVASHSVGTDRWGMRSVNKNECTGSDWIASFFGKGFIAKDAQGTPHYWRYTVAADGTPAVVDIGTAAPTT